MIRIGAKKLAELSHASHAQLRSQVRAIKYPDEDANAAGSAYHAEARRYIYEFHARGRSTGWLQDKADDLRARSRASTRDYDIRRLASNASGLEDYIDSFSTKTYADVERVSLPLDIGDLRIGLKADFKATYRGRQTVFRLEMARTTRTARGDQELDTMLRLYTHAALEAGLVTSHTAVKLLDVPTGRVINGPRIGPRFVANVEALAESISNIWDAI